MASIGKGVEAKLLPRIRKVPFTHRDVRVFINEEVRHVKKIRYGNITVLQYKYDQL